jgi:F-type H+-transporting ATPase subunit epsilon
MNVIKFQLITPERTVLSQELASLSCPTQMGQITILPNHAALVATLVPGELLAKNSAGEEFFINVTGGFVQVQKGSQVTVLADAAEHFYEINTQRAEEAKQRAEAALKEARLSGEEYAKVAASLEKSLARLNVARKRSHRKTPLPSEGVFSQ